MSLEKTLLQKLRVAYPNGLDSFNNRTTQAGLLQAFLQSTNSPSSIISQDFREKASNSMGRILEVPVMKKGNVTLKNQRTCEVECTNGESDLLEITWKTLVADVCMKPAVHFVNQVSYEAELNRQITEVVEKFLVTIEEDITTALDLNVSQVYNSPIVNNKYSLVGNAIQVPTALQDYFFGDIDAINYADDYNQNMKKVIANHSLMPYVNQFMNQGLSNAENKAWQFANIDYSFSNRIVNGGSALATGYFMPNGAVGFLTRTDYDAKARHIATDGTRWFQDRLSGLPWNIGVKFNSKCDDITALQANGLNWASATMVEHWQFSFDYTIVMPYNEDIATRPNPIRKFEFVP